MRSVLWFLILTLSLQAQERYCIEVLSTKDKASITRELMDKVVKMSLPHSVKYLDGEYKVFLGNFETREAAEPVLEKVRKDISEEAIVSIYQEKKRASELNPKATMQQAMLMAQAKALGKTKESEEQNATAAKPIEAPEIKKVSGAAEKKPVKTVMTKQPKESEGEQFCKSSKKILRESEISEALEFYMNSSFYSFTD